MSSDVTSRLLIRCMGGRFCRHKPGTCTADPVYQAEIARHRAPDAEPVATYRHVKRGTAYAVIGEAELQCATHDPSEGDELIIYRGKDGKLWARMRDEFHDGRFERIEDTHP